MIPLADQTVDYDILLGEIPAIIQTQVPFSPIRCDFLAALSQCLLRSSEAKQFPDVITFAYECRRANLERLKSQYGDIAIRLGLGLVFHITPANVPINFAFSFLMGFLSGNVNLVRVPTKPFRQVSLILESMATLLQTEAFSSLKNTFQFIRYDKNTVLTHHFSNHANARLLWGGDAAINAIRSLPVPVRLLDIVFSDRYSLCLLNAEKLIALSEKELSVLVRHFYNDAYTMDQRACASPHIVLWLGEKSQAARALFWHALRSYVKENYRLTPMAAMDKYVQWCIDAIDCVPTPDVLLKDNFVHHLSFEKSLLQVENLRGQFGYFYEFFLEKEEDFLEFVGPKCQTVTYFGFNPDHLRSCVIQKGIQGVDRIVPVGSALAMNLFWDGYDVIRLLSRVIVI